MPCRFLRTPCAWITMSMELFLNTPLLWRTTTSYCNSLTSIKNNMSGIYDFNLDNIPNRTVRPRTDGVTMVMDKGLSMRQAEDLLAVGTDYVDFVKLGFGTSVVTKNLKEKIKLYTSAGMKVYLGGTLLEAF